jgi:hypothetical protein
MRGRCTFLVTVALGTLGIISAQASAASTDIAATHAYIEANYALAKASVARIDPGQAKIESLNGELARECPGAGSGSAEDEASQPVSYVVAVALWSVAYGSDAGPISAFVKAAGHLRWSNRAITRLDQKYARNLHELATLPLPPLCEDVRSWKASGFQTIPATALALDDHEQAIEEEAIPARLLAPYERGDDARILQRTEALETKLEEREFLVGQGDWIQVLETLGLHQ